MAVIHRDGAQLYRAAKGATWPAAQHGARPAAPAVHPGAAYADRRLITKHNTSLDT